MANYRIRNLNGSLKNRDFALKWPQVTRRSVYDDQAIKSDTKMAHLAISS